MKLKIGKVLQQLNYSKVEAYKEMYPRETFPANLAFQERGLIVIICFHCEILTKRPLSKGFKTNTSGFSLFFFALEAILKVYLASFNHGNGCKTTCVGDTVGYNYLTMHFGNTLGWRKREDKQPVSVSYVLARETTKELLN